MTSGIKLPDVPTLSRPSTVEASLVAATPTDAQFVPRTLRVFAFVVVVIVAGLAGTGRFDLIAPFVGGAALAAVLLAGFEIVVRRVFTADAVLAERGVSPAGTQSSPKKFNGKAAILWFALIKYPAVAVLIYFVIRTGSTAQIVAFATGFVCLQLVVGLRGLGAFLLPRPAPK